MDVWREKELWNAKSRKVGDYRGPLIRQGGYTMTVEDWLPFGGGLKDASPGTVARARCKMRVGVSGPTVGGYKMAQLHSCDSAAGGCSARRIGVVASSK